MDIQICKATTCDLEQINLLESSLEHRILSYETLNSTLDLDTYHYYVAIKDKTILGYIAAEYMVDHLDLLSIAVLEKYRKQGIATLLLEKLIDMCSNMKISNIFLEVRCSNFSAIKFYEKNGFKNISCRKNYYPDTKEDAYIYKKMV